MWTAIAIAAGIIAAVLFVAWYKLSIIDYVKKEQDDFLDR